MTSYTVHAGDHSTDLGMVGRASTLRSARALGRKQVDGCLPGGCGTYTIRDADGQDVERGERSLRTGYRWHVAS